MADYEIARGPAAGRRAKTPLFAVASGAPLRRGNVSKHFDAWMAQVGAARGWASGESKKYSVHSFRVHLTCAGASDARIQSMLRWASIDALNCYKQTMVETYGAWVAAASQTELRVNRSHHLPRDESDGRAPAMPAPEVPVEQRTRERAQQVRYEADDIVGAARAGGLEALMAEASLLDDEVRRAVAPDDDVADILSTFSA
jgi:hypothetical protein